MCDLSVEGFSLGWDDLDAFLPQLTKQQQDFQNATRGVCEPRIGTDHRSDLIPKFSPNRWCC